MVKNVLKALGVLVALLLVAEIGLRLLGKGPYQAPEKIVMEPRSPYIFDSILGWRLDSGQFHIVHNGIDWKVTNGPDGYRITSFNDTLAEDARPRINVYGGPSTYGYGLRDDETYPYLLQQRLPQYKVVNYAIPGFGVPNNYLQLIHTNPRPGDIYIFTYFSDSDKRPSKKWLKEIYPSIQDGTLKNVYYVKMDTNLNYTLQAYDFKLWSLSRYSALANYIEDAGIANYDNTRHAREIAKKAFVEMNKWCKERGCKFFVIGRRKDALTQEMIKYLPTRGVPVANISGKNISFGIKGDKPDATPNLIFVDSVISYMRSQGIITTGLAGNF